MGRKKIAIKKQEDLGKRFITFSKRRKGLYNKAAELCMLSDAKLAIFVKSPGANSTIYAFGYPSIDAVADAYLAASSPAALDDTTRLSMLSERDEARELEQQVAVEKAKLQSGGWEKQDIDSYKSVKEVARFLESSLMLKGQLVDRFNSCVVSSKGGSSAPADHHHHHHRVHAHDVNGNHVGPTPGCDHQSNIVMPGGTHVISVSDYPDHDSITMELRGMDKEGNEDGLNMMMGNAGLNHIDGVDEMSVMSGSQCINKATSQPSTVDHVNADQTAHAMDDPLMMDQFECENLEFGEDLRELFPLWD